MPTREILESHSATTLKKEISKTNIKGYSKMKKAELVDLMLKHKDRFHHIKMAEKKTQTKKTITKKDPAVQKKAKEFSTAIAQGEKVAEKVRKTADVKPPVKKSNAFTSNRRMLGYIMDDIKPTGHFGMLIRDLTPYFSRYEDYSKRMIKTDLWKRVESGWKKLDEKVKQSIKKKVEEVIEDVIKKFGNPHEAKTSYKYFLEKPILFIREALDEEGLDDKGSVPDVWFNIEKSGGELKNEWNKKTRKNPTPFSMLIKELAKIY